MAAPGSRLKYFFTEQHICTQIFDKGNVSINKKITAYTDAYLSNSVIMGAT